MGPLRPKKLSEREEEVKEEYLKTLQDLTFNSKPLIDVLTEVAAENKEYAACIVECIEEQLENVSGPLKLPILYLIDSIIKCETIKQYYMPLFYRKIHILFMKVYELGDENIRNKLAKLRFTWNGVLPPEILATLDNAVRTITPNWQAAPPPAVHVNPKFISAGVTAANVVVKSNPAPTKEELRQKRKELLELTQRKQELEEELKVLRPAQMKPKLGDKTTEKVLPKPKVAEEPPTYSPQIPTSVLNIRPNLANKTWNKSSPNQYVFINKANGCLPSQPQTPQNVPAFRIAPVNSLLIHAAAKRARDPRLQKVSNVTTSKKLPPNSDATTIVNGRREIAASTPRIVESKNDKRNESPEKPVVAEAAASKKTEPSTKSKSVSSKDSSSTMSASASEEMEPCAKKRKIEKVSKVESPPRASNSGKKEESRKRKALSESSNDKHESDSPSPEKRRSNGDSAAKSKTTSSKKRSSASSMSAAIDELFEDTPKKDEKKATKTYSKEERAKRLRILMHTPTPETERLLESLTKKSPRIAEKFIRLLNKEKETLKTSPVVDVDADSSPKSEQKSPTPKIAPEESDSVDVDCVILSSPKPIVEKMKSPPRLESIDEYDPIADLPEPEESLSPKADPKIEPAACTPPSQDVDLRSLIAPASVIIPPVSAPVIVPPNSCNSPPTAPPPPMFPFMVPGMEFGFPGMVQPSTIEVPSANVDMLERIDRDPLTTINIDGVPREIRHYGSTAVVFLNWDDPREILFSSHDVPRRIVVDGKYTIECKLNALDVERMIYGKSHKFRLGAPTRELYIDGIGYECFFGGPAINVWLDGRTHSVRLEGRPPKVDIGPKRLDLVAGKVNMIVNDKHTFALFLDAKAQKIEVEGVKFIITFIDSLQRVLINDAPFRTDFGGINHSFTHHNKLFYFRLSMLPMGILPGAVTIYQMITSKLPSPPPLPPSLRYTTSEEFPVLPVPPMMSNVPMMPVTSIPTPIIMSSAEPSTSTVSSQYSAGSNEPSTSSPAVKDEESSKEALSIDELVQKLLAEGLVSLPDVTSTSSVREPSPPKPTRFRKSKKETIAHKDEPLKHVDLKKPETLKQKQPGMIAILYTGNQCGSCGLRFPEEQTLKYSEHLDWHFRLNRRGKDGARTIHSRKWYYKADSWMQFQEMEDESDRGQSWFDNHPATEYTEEVMEEVPCVRASPDIPEECELCRDRFEQFYNQELDEWQLRNAIYVDCKIYHPICFQDHKDHVDHSDDVEEIVDMTEPILVMEDEPSSITEDNIISVDDIEVPDISFIKKEKEDSSTVAEKGENACEVEKPTQESEGKSSNKDEEEDSDIEEVQLIEEPIEEIIIPDDGNEFDDSNLETLHVEDIITSPDVEREESTFVETPVEDPSDKIVDITQSVSTVSIDGNVDPGDTMPLMARGPTVIKLNIGKSHFEEKMNSPAELARSSPPGDETEKLEKVNDFSTTSSINEEPPPPGEEMMVTLVPTDIKQKLRERKLTEYPPVKKGTGDSSLCSIM